MKRTASAVWQGSGKEGNGHLSTQSGVLSQNQYSFNTRFADGIGTNPEELVAAAHAGCFAMKLSFCVGNMGFTPEILDVNCTIVFDTASGTVAESQLTLKAKIAGISAEQFAEAVADAEQNCPISKLLNAKISVDASLEN